MNTDVEKAKKRLDFWMRACGLTAIATGALSVAILAWASYSLGARRPTPWPALAFALVPASLLVTNVMMKRAQRAFKAEWQKAVAARPPLQYQPGMAVPPGSSVEMSIDPQMSAVLLEAHQRGYPIAVQHGGIVRLGDESLREFSILVGGEVIARGELHWEGGGELKVGLPYVT